MTAPAGCTWKASSNSSWLKILSGGSGTGNGWVTYNVQANKGGTRTGTITAGGQTFTVTQSGSGAATSASTTGTSTSAGCSYTLGRTTVSAPAAGGANSVKMTATSGCAWSATSNSSWLTILSGSGKGTGWVTYSAAANTGASRTGTISVAGLTLTVNQP